MPFTIYTYFEDVLPNMQQTLSYGYYIHCNFDNNLSKYVSYRGDDCLKKFIISIVNDIFECEKNYYHKFHIKGDFNCYACKTIKNGQKIFICPVTYKNEMDFKLCDHHFIYMKYVPIIIHNITEEDTKRCLKEVIDYSVWTSHKVEVKKFKDESIVAFTQELNNRCELRYIHSSLFIENKLSVLADKLEYANFEIMKNLFTNINVYKYPVRREGILPLKIKNLTNSFQKTSLPRIEHFSTSSKLEQITADEYNNVKFIWDNFNIRNLGDYFDFHVKCNVAILSDVFECTRNLCYNLYNLELMHYFTLENFSWDAMMKDTKITLDNISDLDIIEFLESGIQTAINYCSPEYVQANNKYMSSFDPDTESSYLIHITSNNLNEWAMSQNLPYKNFQWLTKHEISRTNINLLDENYNLGYIFEVEFEDSYDNVIDINLPVYPLKSNIFQDETTEPRKQIIHFQALKQCLNLGLRIKCIHRVLSFQQKKWLRPFIKKCSQNIFYNPCFEQIILNLIKTEIYNTIMEKNGKTKRLLLIRPDSKILLDYNTATIDFNRTFLINKDCLVIEKELLQIEYNKPIFLSFTIRQLVMSQMYNFHYHIIKCKYNNNATLMYADISSFMYKIRTLDFYNDLKDSIILQNAFRKSADNRTQHFYVRDECEENILVEYVGLRGKIYALKTISKVELLTTLEYEEKNDDVIRVEGDNKSYYVTQEIVKYYPSISRFNSIRKVLMQNKFQSHIT